VVAGDGQGLRERYVVNGRIRTEVIVVGFGPVGAVLAGLLGRRGLTVVALDRELDVYGLPRAAHIDHTGLRILQELDLLDTLLPTMIHNAGLDFITSGDELLIRVPGNQSSISGLPASMYFHQPNFDRSVRRAVSALDGVDVRLGYEVSAVVVTGDSAVVTAVGQDGDRIEVEAPWVVGCDGSGSFVRASSVRASSNIEVEDLQFEERWLVVDLIQQEAAQTNGHAVCRCDPTRPTYSIPMPELRHRFEFMLMREEDGDSMQAPTRVLELVAPWKDPADVAIERSAIYTFHGVVARQWRRGPILIAGDAAHQMPPFLGQGMCSGLRDAANLAWKLDLVVRGNAPDGLLDTYGQERAPHVRKIVEAAIAFGEVICTTDPADARARDKRLLSDPTPATQRMPFGLPPLDSGELVLDGGGDLFVQPQSGDGRRLDDVIGQRFAVIARNEAALGHLRAMWENDIGAFVATLDSLGSAATIGNWLDSRSADVVIVRPDRYVLWAGTDLAAPSKRVRALLRRSGASSGSAVLSSTRAATAQERS
jgi:3-(3-hydroxy-phenyl)propionate hydroxylase